MREIMVTQTIGPGRPSPLGPYGPGKPGWPRSPCFYKRECQNNIQQIRNAGLLHVPKLSRFHMAHGAGEFSVLQTFQRWCLQWCQGTFLPATPQPQSFNVLPLDQVIHGLSPQSDRGDQKTQYHPSEKKSICNLFPYITRHKLGPTFFCCCLPYNIFFISLMMWFCFIHLWTRYGPSWLSLHALLAWYPTFTLHVESG